MREAAARLSRDRGLLLLLGLLLLGLPLVTIRIYATDEIKYFSHLHSALFDGDLNFTNDYTYWRDLDPVKHPERASLLRTNPTTGLPINEAPVGTAILWTPFFALAHLVVLGARALGAKVAADGYSPPYIAAVCYASYLYGWAGLLLSYGLVRRFAGQFVGVLATLSVWLGTSAFFYMLLAPPWSHSASLFTVALFTTVWVRTRGRRSLASWAGLGAAGGLMMMVREQDALFLLLPVVEWLWTLTAKRTALRTQAAALIFGPALAVAALVLTFTPQLAAYWVLGGRLGPSSTVSEKLDWLSPHALEVLLSPQYGWWPWAPVALPALLGLLVLARHDRQLALALALAVAAQVFVAGAFSTWQGRSSFGQRRFVNCTVVLVIGLGAAVQAARARGVARPWLAAVAALFAAWDVGLAVQYALWTSAQRQIGLQWPAVLLDQISLPLRLPGIIWRFLFDKGSLMRGYGEVDLTT